MPMPTFPLARLGGFRSELHACFSRRADALFELGDALLCTQTPLPSLPHLSLEPVCRRGWGSAYAALARGRIDAERLRDLLVGGLPDTDQRVFAVDVTTWPRCDAECSPERGYYYHPSRHSAGQPIIAGWAFQWIGQLSFDRDSWTAPVDARRLHPLDDTDQTAAGQIRALVGRLNADASSGRVPLFVFDGGYDSAQLTLDLAEQRVALLVRLRADRCFYADPPPQSRSPKGGRPRRHGAKFNCADPTTWPAPTATLVTATTSTAPSLSPAGRGCTPSSSATPATAAAGRGRSCAAPSCASRSSASPPRRARRRCCGCGGPAPASSTWSRRGAPMSAGSTWSTRSGSASRPWAGPRRGRGTPPRPTAGPGWCWPPTPNCAWPARSSRTRGCRESGPAAGAAVTSAGLPRVSATSGAAGLPGGCAETRWALSRPAQGQPLRARHAVSSDQEAHQEGHQESDHGHKGRLTGSDQPARPPTRSAANPACPKG